MNTLLGFINGLACGLISMVLIGAVLSPKVDDGIVIKVGLICLAAGFGSIALRMLDGIAPDEIIGLERGLLLVNAGIAVVIVGYVLRQYTARHRVRRASDWIELDEASGAVGGER